MENKDKSMDRHGARYYFEHRLLPHLFFEDPERLVSTIIYDKGLLFHLINSIFEEAGIENPYSEADFDAKPSRLTDEVLVLKLVFPAPEEEPLCYWSYLFFDEAFEKVGYYCIEKGNEHSGNYPFVCSWTKDGCHNNHGGCTFEDHDDFYRCADHHMEVMYGMKRVE